MYQQHNVSVVIPALNEQGAIGLVISQLWALRDQQGRAVIDEIVVCDNGSTDKTAAVACQAGANVVFQPQRGYGIACQTAIQALQPTDIILFIDADRSCIEAQSIALIHAVATGADLAIGSRTLGTMQRGSLSVPQRFGNWLASRLIGLLWGYSITDLGPFRAIHTKAFQQLNMVDPAFGWTVEMQIKAIQQKMQIVEVAVDSTKRIGVSKISGNILGVMGAAKGILGTIALLRLKEFKHLILFKYLKNIFKKKLHNEC